MLRGVINSGYRFYVCIHALIICSIVLLSIAYYLNGGALSNKYFTAVVVFIFVSIISIFASYIVQQNRNDQLVQIYKYEIEASEIDQLTGCFNRDPFIDRVRHFILENELQNTLFFRMDAHNIKKLNDTHSYRAGDAALAQLVATVRRLAPDALIGRLGGDEFAVLLTADRPEQKNIEIVRAVPHLLSMVQLVDAPEWQLSAAIGVLRLPSDASNVRDVLHNSDLALQSAKLQGSDVLQFFNDEMRSKDESVRALTRDLQSALQFDELEIHYQPVVHSTTGELRSYEALLRWKHPIRGMISPNEFIPIAERTEVIHELGDWVLKRVAADLPELGTPVVTVNVSGVQLGRANFAERFLKVAREVGLPTDRVVIEITETSRFEAEAIELANLKALRDANVEIAIDDFGAGHASLQYLRFIPFQKIKIDRSYVVNIEDDAVSRALVAAICGIGRSLGARVVAEGVETEQQKILVTAAGCTHIQGYLIGRPLPLRDIVANRQRSIAA